LLTAAAAEQVQQQLQQQLGVALPAPQHKHTYRDCDPVLITDVQSYYKVHNALRKATKAAAKLVRALS
jgi:hypothetical protein